MIHKRRMISSILCGLLLSFGCQQEKIVYPPGRDTVSLFGDGRFRIAKVNKIYYLYDIRTHETVAFDVRNWCTQGNFIYTLDKKGVCQVVNYRTGEKKEYPTLEDVPFDTRTIFNNLQ